MYCERVVVSANGSIRNEERGHRSLWSANNEYVWKTELFDCSRTVRDFSEPVFRNTFGTYENPQWVSSSLIV